MDTDGRKLLKDASKIRETGEFLKALQIADEAMISFSDNQDIPGFSESLAERSLNLRHLYGETGDKNYLYVARSQLQGAVEIARNSGDDSSLAIPLYNLAKVYEDLGNLNDAINYYREALDFMQKAPPKSHNRPAVISDMKIHLFSAEYISGDQSALFRTEQALTELEHIPEQDQYDHTDSSYNDLDFVPSEESYNKKVWVSGAHMRIAKMLKDKDPEKAQEHLKAAKIILDSDERLILRFKQWQKLAKEFTPTVLKY